MGIDEPKVNTLIIGAARSGTTSLYEHLAAHPEVCFSATKEPPHFSIDEHYEKGPAHLHRFFSHYKGEPIVATADTYLFIHHKAILRVANYNPKMRILIMLREPVARAYASFQYAQNNGYESVRRSFSESMQLEHEELNTEDIQAYNNRAHLLTSMYHKHISKWLNYFPHWQIKILTLDDMKNHPEKFFTDLYNYLEIAPTSTPEAHHVNAARTARSKQIQQMLLNRNHPMRRMLKFVLPVKAKERLMHSGLIEKLKRANSKDRIYKPISDQEKALAKKYLQADITRFRNEFGDLFSTSA